MKYYEFYAPVKVMSGENAIDDIPFEVVNNGCKKPFIMTSEMLTQTGHLKILQAAFEGSEADCSNVYTDIPVDSSTDSVQRAAEVYKKLGCDCIIALGGGSVIDTSKGLTMVLAHDHEDILNLKGSEQMKKADRPLFIVIPTTAGTGSETTNVAVIKDPKAGQKLEFLSPYLLPDVAVLDVRMTATMPAFLTASTGADAMVHAVEAFSCLQANPISDGFAISALRLITQNLEKVCTKPDNESRLAMAQAAFIAGVAFSNSMVGGVHAIGHCVGAVCGVAHGDAMAILLPHLMQYNMEVCADKYAQIFPMFATPEEVHSVPPTEWAQACYDKISSMFNRLAVVGKLPRKLSERGVTQESFAQIAKKSIGDGAMIMNPKEIDYDDVMFILKQAL